MLTSMLTLTSLSYINLFIDQHETPKCSFHESSRTAQQMRTKSLTSRLIIFTCKQVYLRLFHQRPRYCLRACKAISQTVSGGWIRRARRGCRGGGASLINCAPLLDVKLGVAFSLRTKIRRSSNLLYSLTWSTLKRFNLLKKTLFYSSFLSIYSLFRLRS